MSKEKPPRFDPEALHRLAGDKVFVRGQTYHQDGRVDILDHGPDRVVARVGGSEIYRATLTGKGARIGGECSCPAFADWGFCKHLVAVALTANEDGGAPTQESALERIRRHLKGKGVDALADMLLDLAERDDGLFRRLDMEAAAVDDDDAAVFSRFRKAITDATRTGGFIHYREAPGWADGVDATLDQVAALASVGRGAVALRLIDHAVARIEKAIDEIDDSDGYCGGLLERARDIHLAACRAARPDPLALARELYAREIDGAWDTFAGAAWVYADALGESGLAEYRRLAVAAWEKIPPRVADRRTDDEFFSARSRLASILDAFAERDGDVEARIALRAHDLSSSWRYLDLARFCQSAGREAEALRYAEEGLWVFADDVPDERLVMFTVDLHLAAGRPEAAEALLWQAFEKRPSLDLYRRLRDLGKATARDRAIGVLRNRLTREKRPTHWHSPADLLIRVLMAEGMFVEAWDAVRTHGASEDLGEALAMAGEASHPREALKVYAAGIDRRVSTGGNANYDEACRLLARMAPLRGQDEHAAHIADLKARFKAKRNFMKLLAAM
ncbi:MAG: SWIM zinc finger family protein [Alphaproteobacteria bacterium]|nr:SWIM zinc finger family protein [Alphaproteobacteria bacterium]